VPASSSALVTLPPKQCMPHGAVWGTAATWLRHLADLALERSAPTTHHTGTTTFDAAGCGSIEREPGIMGGDARIIRIRIPVRLLVGLRRDGMSDIELLDNYPSLTQAYLNQAWGYARSHQAEIERALRQPQAA
jgi:uncharacterized protein (DUF433 family)